MSEYASDDLRAGLDRSSVIALPSIAADVKLAQWIEFLSLPPSDVSEHGTCTWHARATNAVVSYSVAKAGDVLKRVAQPDEYAVLQYLGSAAVRVVCASGEAHLAEPAFVVVPPGNSQLEVLTDGVVIRLYSAEADDLRDGSLNADAYAYPDLRCARLEPWPDPVGGFRLREYRLADFPISEKRFGRIFRTTNLMVNFLAEESGPRNPLKLSPHQHEDFEQVSLALKGRFIHHIRYPWGPDATQWQEDEHREIATPSVCIIPPRTIHTSQGIGSCQQLVDIFSPPRSDFSEAGWVLNANDYPERGRRI